jgi:4-amino-4-deoxy-L-arabinose transferase-like glycosyltransferase
MPRQLRPIVRAVGNRLSLELLLRFAAENGITPAMGKLTQKQQVLLILTIALVVRTAHLVVSVNNPFFYALSADENYYLAFGRDVAEGGFGLTPRFGFMDPLYGYVMGVWLAIVGEDLFLFRLFQILIDVISVYLIVHIGTLLRGFRAGCIAAVLYAFCGSAIFYTGLLLKPTLVALFVLLWTLLTLRVLVRERAIGWAGLGMLTGIAGALRSNLILLLPLGLLAPIRRGRDLTPFFKGGTALLLGFMIVQTVLAWRHYEINNFWSWLPSNGGIVLYQVYAPEHLRGGLVVPAFVEEGSPAEIQQFFLEEARRRTGQLLDARQANAWWSAQAWSLIKAEPAAAFEHLLKNGVSFFSGYEVPNNRSIYIDRQFSAVLAMMPISFSVLIGMALPGFVIAVRHRREALVLLAPVAVAFITYVVFFDFSRFRFPAVPLLALASGIFIDQCLCLINARRFPSVALFIIIAGLLAAISTQLGPNGELGAFERKKIAEAYVKAGQLDQAENRLSDLLREYPDDAWLYELAGYVHLQRGRISASIDASRRAVALDPRRHVAHYNLAVAYQDQGDIVWAVAALRQAIAVRPRPDYRLRLASIIAEDDPYEAALLCNAVLAEVPEHSEFAAAARRCLSVSDIHE